MQTTTLGIAILTMATQLLFAQVGGKSKSVALKKITPVLLVEEVEPCARFWVDRLGFEKTMEVPEGSKIGFAILKKGDLELMYQTYSSQEKDAPAVARAMPKGPTFLYVEVDNLDDIIATTAGSEVIMPVRTAFYGAREIGVKDPAGHVVTFAQFAAAPQH